MPSLLDALQTLRPVSLRRGPRDFHSVAKQASFCIAFWSDFGGFWSDFGGQNGCQNRFLGCFFAMLFSTAFWHRFLIDFRRLKTWKIAISLRKNNDFYKIDVFEKSVEKTSILALCWGAKTMTNPEKMVLKSELFLTSIFLALFYDFGSIWGGPGLSKNR